MDIVRQQIESPFKAWAIDWYQNYYLQSYPLDYPCIQNPQLMLDFYTWCESINLKELSNYLQVAQASYWFKKCFNYI